MTVNMQAPKASSDLFGFRTLYRNLRTAYRRASGMAAKLEVSPSPFEVARLGTSYGGWSFVDTGALLGSTIVSCGLGEDASFDVEFASRFHAKVIVADPTPRAALHFRQIAKRIGCKAAVPYSDSGKQPVEAYDLSALTPGSLTLVDKALWTECKPVKLYMPENPDFVSHSLVNGRTDGPMPRDFIEVNAISVDALLDTFAMRDLPLLKLDIEGAEIEVIKDMLEKKIFPGQLLVEYDEFRNASKDSKRRIESAHFALLDCSYRLIHFDYPSNFLYVRMATD
jgi:FkbM family methyltransferase